MRPTGSAPVPARPDVDLYWIPLGAGARVVRLTGAVYEALTAVVRRRRRRPLFHAALVAAGPDGAFVIEMTPVPGRPGGERGVVAEGPVGSRWLGRLRIFRYEIRRWRDGAIPDLSHAVGGPVRITDDPDVTRHILALVPLVPTPVWGRDEQGAGEMWNSNSVVAWVLARAGVEEAAWPPPLGGRAPGWDAGVVVAARRIAPHGDRWAPAAA